VRRRTAFLLLAAVLAAPLAARSRAAPVAQAEQVDALFAEYATTRTPGCAVGVIRGGAFVLRRGYGMANLEHGVPLGADTVFRIGSTSKQFTAAAVLLLAERSRLSLDDDVRTYVPELPVFDPPVTIRHLLHHTSGYRDYLTLMRLAGYRDADYYTDEDLLVMLSRQRELNFAPGAEFLYSNSGYWLLSQVVERVSGVSLKDFAATAIFGPLGMASTHFHDDYRHVVPNRASGYAPSPDGGFRISMTTLPMVGDGGVFTTVDDLLAWDRSFYENRIGSPRFVERMQSVGTLNDGTALDYALGLRLGTYRGLPTVSHGGAFVGFRAEMLRFPAQRLSVICLCNRADANPSRLARAVSEIYLGQEMTPAAESAASPAGRGPSPPPTTITLPDGVMRQFVGRYVSDELDVAYAIELEGSDLRLRVGRAPARTLQPVGNRRLQAGGLLLRFEIEDASVTGFRLDAGRVTNLWFRKLPASRLTRSNRRSRTRPVVTPNPSTRPAASRVN
jgi:CubicO group peptidase (beta-lactamase class C family)